MDNDLEQKSQYEHFGILASSSWYFWTKTGRKSNVDFWKLDRDVFFELTYQVLQLRMEINRSEAIGSFSESPTDFDAGAGVSEPRFWYKSWIWPRRRFLIQK